ncbi:MAG: hypothetical protein ACREL1_07240 [bacterium]
MTENKNPIDAYFQRHWVERKAKVREALKAVVSIHKFSKPADVYKKGRLDETPTEEKNRRKPL